MPYEIIPDDVPATPGFPIIPQAERPSPTVRQIAHAVGRQFGLTGRYLIEGAYSPFEMLGTVTGKLASYASGGALPNPEGGAVSRALTNFGFPEGESAMERIVGDVSRALVGTGGVIGAMRYLLTKGLAPEAAKQIITLVQSNAGAQATGAAGAGAAGGAARESGFGPGGQLAATILGGVMAPTAGNMAWEATKGAGRFAQGLVAPFVSQAGREAAAGNVVNALATEPGKVNSMMGVSGAQQAPANGIRQLFGYPAAPAPGNALRASLGYGPMQPPNPAPVPQYVPGSQPTVAQITGDPGLLRAEGGLRSATPAFIPQDVANNAARTAYLQRIAGTPDDLAAATAAREAGANHDYDFAFTSPMENTTPQMNRALNRVLDRPAMQQAWAAAEKTAANMGWKPEVMNTENPRFMHLVKMQLDDIINAIPDSTSAGRTASAAASTGIGGSEGTKTAFLNALDNLSPFYGVARGNYEQASKPINQMTTLQDIMKSAVGSQPLVDDLYPLSQAKWKNQVTNNSNELAQTLMPDQMKVLENIGLDLDRAGRTGSVKPLGSPTFQNLASDAALSSAVGRDNAMSPVGQLLALPIRKLFEYAGSNEAVRNILAEAMQDPVMMRKILQASQEGANPTLGSLFAPRVGAAAQGAALGYATEAGGSP